MARTTFNLPVAIAEEVRAEAERLDRTIQWVLIQAWRKGVESLRQRPTVKPEDK